jgi:UDP:flavonoid glycosyltransferase YjiC (YdhE family)
MGEVSESDAPSSGRPLRVLVLASSGGGGDGGGGDGPPLIGAAAALQKAGHEISVFADEAVAAALQGTTLPVEALTDIETLEARQRRYREGQDSDVPFPLMGWAKEAAPFAVPFANAFQPDLLLCSDFTSTLGYRVRKEIGTPMCIIHATYYTGEGSRRSVEEDFGHAAGAMMGSLTAAGDLVLLATDPIYDPPPDPVPPNHHWVGTLIWEPVKESPAWLEEPGDPWLLMTLSSARQDGEIELARAAVAAAAEFPVRLLVTLADGKSADGLRSTSDKVRVETFVPHSRVLESAGLCIAHAGHGIVAKALKFGVPMVLVPWDRDQPGVAARAEALGVAKVVPRSALSPESLTGAIREVLGTPSYGENARLHSERIRTYDSAALVREKIEAFLR